MLVSASMLQPGPVISTDVSTKRRLIFGNAVEVILTPGFRGRQKVASYKILQRRESDFGSFGRGRGVGEVCGFWCLSPVPLVTVEMLGTLSRRRWHGT